jgi:hypothetical protein
MGRGSLKIRLPVVDGFDGYDDAPPPSAAARR